MIILAETNEQELLEAKEKRNSKSLKVITLLILVITLVFVIWGNVFVNS